MKTLHVILGAGLVASSNVALARKVEVTSFDNNPVAFQIIEPGHIPLKAAEAETNQAAADPLQLDREFASLTGNTDLNPSTGGVDQLSVPTWMRISARPPRSSAGGTLHSFIPLGGCGAVRYTPHPTLNAAQELRRERYFTQMAAAACGAGVPVELFDALIIQESRYNPLALSSKGASGLTQLMPDTARSLGVFNRWSVSQNLSGGARYLRKQLDTFGNWALALGAYNAGPGNVSKYGGLPPFRETRGYVRTILASVTSYQVSRGGPAKFALSARREVSLTSFSR